MGELDFLSATDLAALVRSRKLSPVEIVESSLARIEAVNPGINAFIQLDPEAALIEARRQAEMLARGEEVGPLAGLPFGVKELEDAVGFRSTSASRVFADRWAEKDEVHVARLKAAGGIILGKTNSPEFGYTAFTSNELFGTTRNPWDLERTPGGSSESKFSSTSCPSAVNTRAADSTSRSTSDCTCGQPRLRLKTIRSFGSGSRSRSANEYGGRGFEFGSEGW